MVKNTAIATLSVLITGCVTTQLTTQGDSVRLTANPDVIADCEFVGNVKGEDRFNGGLIGQSAAEENAMRRLLNQAAEIGADTVQISTNSKGFGGSTIRGEAYSCPR